MSSVEHLHEIQRDNPIKNNTCSTTPKKESKKAAPRKKQHHPPLIGAAHLLLLLRVVRPSSLLFWAGVAMLQASYNPDCTKKKLHEKNKTTKAPKKFPVSAAGRHTNSQNGSKTKVCGQKKKRYKPDVRLDQKIQVCSTATNLAMIGTC